MFINKLKTLKYPLPATSTSVNNYLSLVDGCIYQYYKYYFGWLIDWWIDRLIDWLIDWLIDRLIDWLVNCWLIKCLRDQRLSPRHFATAYGDHQLYDSLLTSTCPAAWEKAEVIPILKEDDHEVAFNNRPLSLLAVASKICENIGLSQFVSYFTHINNNNRLSSHKSGNRKFHSTETLIIHTTDAILEGMDNKKKHCCRKLSTGSIIADYFTNCHKSARQLP